jgi:hypothetical protein
MAADLETRSGVRFKLIKDTVTQFPQIFIIAVYFKLSTLFVTRAHDFLVLCAPCSGEDMRICFVNTHPFKENFSFPGQRKYLDFSF